MECLKRNFDNDDIVEMIEHFAWRNATEPLNQRLNDLFSLLLRAYASIWIPKTTINRVEKQYLCRLDCDGETNDTCGWMHWLKVAKDFAEFRNDRIEPNTYAYINKATQYQNNKLVLQPWIKATEEFGFTTLEEICYLDLKEQVQTTARNNRKRPIELDSSEEEAEGLKQGRTNPVPAAYFPDKNTNKNTKYQPDNNNCSCDCENINCEN